MDRTLALLGSGALFTYSIMRLAARHTAAKCLLSSLLWPVTLPIYLIKGGELPFEGASQRTTQEDEERPRPLTSLRHLASTSKQNRAMTRGPDPDDE